MFIKNVPVKKTLVLKSHKLFPEEAVLSIPSLSASAKARSATTVDSFLPVNLEYEVSREFKKHFHPKASDTKQRPPKGGEVKAAGRQKSYTAPKMYVDLAMYMADISAYLEAIFSGLRVAYHHAENWAASNMDVGAEISNSILHYYSSAPDIEHQVQQYITAMSFGGQHVIRESVRFKDGMDVLFLGQRGPSKSSLLNISPINPPTLTPLTASYAHKTIEEKSGQPIMKALIETGWLIQKNLLDSENLSTLKGSYSRSYEQHLIPDFKKKVHSFLNKVFTTGPLSALGIAVQLPEFNAALNPAAMGWLSKYNSILIVREPEAAVVRARATAAKGTPDESVGISLIYQALQPIFAFSFALNIPKPFVEYIVQSKTTVPLAALNVWASMWVTAMMRPPGKRSNGGSSPARIPHYVIMPSMSANMSKRRTELGLYSESGRSNKDNLYITERGNLAFLPKQEEAIEENAKKYEALVEDCLKASYEVGAPLITSQEGSAGQVYDLVNPEYKEKIRLLKGQLHNYKGCLQTYNWDLNCIITTSVVSPDRFVSTKLTGCARPDELNIATYMRDSFSAGMCNMFGDSSVVSGQKRIKPTPEHFSDLSGAIEESSLFLNIAAAYNMFEKQKLVPSLEDLIKRAAEALKIKNLNDESVARFEIDRFNSKKSIYGTTLTPELVVTVKDDNPGLTILGLLRFASVDAAALGRSNLAAYCIQEKVDPADTGRYFDPNTHSIHEFSNLFQYFGGQVFLQAMKAIIAIPSKDLMKIQEAVDPANRQSFVSFPNLQSEVIPFCIMFGKYVTDLKEPLFKRADEIAENNKHPKVSEDELNIAGSRPPSGTRPGMQLFPHQAECLSILKNHPRIAVLDIAPGGGKTTLGICDIAMLYADGLVNKPFIICPNGLVGNWAEDINKHMEGRWNIIPVTTETYANWGDERLTDLIKSAPRNTIVIVGNSFLGNRGKFQLILGNAVENVSDSLEFCKKFHPDYIFVDESHRMRNTNSNIHRYVKSLMQMSSLKYGRIGTGTYIQNVLSDAVGQTALFNAQVFRTKDEFDSNHKAFISSIGGEEVYDYTSDAPSMVRRRLGEFATIISYKRKEWAFMLPLPVETFISVNFEDVDDSELGRQHRMFYDAVLKQTMEELKNDRIVQGLLKGSSSDEDDDEEDDSADGSKINRKVSTSEGANIDVTDSDDDSDNLDELEAALQPYLQRLERILTDPLGDEDLAEVAKQFFGSAKRDTFVTAKVKKAVDRIKKHFVRVEWKKGGEYKSSDIVDFNGKSYIFKSEEPIGHSTEKTTKSPEEDTENWKLQAHGKVMVFCRFTRSVDAVYRALPADLKKQAVVFHGEVEGDKWENLDKFKTDPKVTILIANEMGISEGHNLQVASRFIRLEAPWAPGELDQSASRIFRPDVTGAYKRETIFLDWILTDGTLEVAKMGRLISKMLRKAKFDELDNPKYYKNLNPLNLPIIKMSLDNIRALNKLSDLCSLVGEGDTGDIHPNSYIGQYQYLVGEMAAEFREMKKTKRAYMIDVKPTPMPEDAKVVEFTPWVKNMRVIDRHDEGLQSLRAVLDEEEHPLTVEVSRNGPKALIGQYVRTEFGLGTIRNATRLKGSKDSEGGNKVSKVWVDLAQGGTVESLSPSKVYLATKLTEKSKNALNAKAPKITDRDKARTAKNKEKAQKAAERAAARQKKFIDGIAGTPAKAKPGRPAKVKPEAVVQNIELYPVVYNNFLALEAVGEDEDLNLKKFGFTKFGSYVWLPVKTYANFTKILDFLEAKFTLAPKTIRLLDSLHDSFQSGRGRKFDVELAPTSQLPQFYRMRHTITKIVNKRKPDLKLYPVVLNGSLMLVIDVATNPVIRKWFNKPIPGTTPVVKFQEADGLDINFFGSKSELIAKVKEIRQSGFNVTNIEDLKAEVASLDLKQVTGK